MFQFEITICRLLVWIVCDLQMGKIDVSRNVQFWTIVCYDIDIVRQNKCGVIKTVHRRLIFYENDAHEMYINHIYVILIFTLWINSAVKVVSQVQVVT